MNCDVNIGGGVLPTFYIFKEKYYVTITSKLQTIELYGDAKNMDDFIIVQRVPYLFQKVILGGISQSNCHLLILDGHGSHITLKVIK